VSRDEHAHPQPAPGNQAPPFEARPLTDPGRLFLLWINASIISGLRIHPGVTQRVWGPVGHAMVLSFEREAAPAGGVERARRAAPQRAHRIADEALGLHVGRQGFHSRGRPRPGAMPRSRSTWNATAAFSGGAQTPEFSWPRDGAESSRELVSRSDTAGPAGATPARAEAAWARSVQARTRRAA
jgi:hypothetical protein